MAGYKEYDSIQKFDMFDGTLESIKSNLFMRLFNKHNLPLNKNLEDVPHINHADLTATFSIEQKTYFDGVKGMYSYLITNEDMEMLKTDERTLKEIAMKNLLDKNSPRIETISQHIIRNHVFSPLTRIPDNVPTSIVIDGPKTDNPKLFEGSEYGPLPIINKDTKDVLIISNRTQTFASINFTISEVLDKVYHEFKENFYIVPSSIHELICIKSSYALDDGNKSEKQAIEDLEDMLERINDVIHKDTSDILSYNIYYHMHDDNCTMIVT